MKGQQRRKTTAKLGPWQRIVRAAGRRQGVRLDAEEVYRLSCDDAVRTKAEVDDALQDIVQDLS